MTTRERASAVLVLVGAACLVTAGAFAAGWWGGLGTAGILLVLVGILLGLGSDQVEFVPPAELDDRDEFPR